jgi:hypothetical protein
VIPAAGGLPSYTLPPATAARTNAPPPFGPRPTPPSTRDTPMHDAPGVPMPGTYSPSAQTSAPAYIPDAQAQSAPPTAPFGVRASGSPRQPFGGSSGPVSTPPATPYGQAGSVPHDRMQGTVYGGMGADSPIDMTMPVSMNAVENSGSLTGHILSQGWAEPADTGRRSNTKVAVVMLIVLLALVGVSLLFLFTAGSAFTDMLHGVFKK